MSSIFDGMAEIFRDTFGEAATYTLAAGGAPVELTGIFRTPALEVQGLAEADIVSAETTIDFAAPDLPAGYGEGDIVVVRGTTYKTKVPRPDGEGMVSLPLFKV